MVTSLPPPPISPAARAKRRPAAGAALALLAWLSSGCTELKPLGDAVPSRPACDDRNELGNVYFGDLHGHTAFSFDAISYDVRSTPADAYRFAQGEPIDLAPYDADGRATRSTRLDRPLDFAALTDHSEFLGETYQCTTPEAESYDTPMCEEFRREEGSGAFLFGKDTALSSPERREEVCGADGERCLEAARQRWQQLRDAADEAYDQSTACTFTSILGYEYTNTRSVSNFHRNVFMRGSTLPDLPVSHYEQAEPLELLQALRELCQTPEADCEVLSIPHNSNLSNGNLFFPRYPDESSLEEQAELARLRAELEPLAEVFQHKGDSECRNGLDTNADDDPLCEFEKLRPADDPVCGDETGTVGMRVGGCVHRLDFLRNVLLEGLREHQRLGVNPYRVGLIGSTDTHNATLGNTAPIDFPGHIGVADDTPEDRLGLGNVTHDGVINNPGGLVAAWAEQNTREAIFGALQRREVYATSGTRITLRLFAGWDYPEDLCSQGEPIAQAYAEGVPMGGVLTGASGTAPRLFVQASYDPGTERHPGALLQRIQIIKGWVDAEGTTHEQVVDVAGDPAAGASMSTSSCEPSSEGAAALCVVWTDPEFSPTELSFYYARVLETPTCRWSTFECNALGAAGPEACSDPLVALQVQHRAWSSPIWFEP